MVSYGAAPLFHTEHEEKEKVFSVFSHGYRWPVRAVETGSAGSPSPGWVFDTSSRDSFLFQRSAHVWARIGIGTLGLYGSLHPLGGPSEPST